MAAGKFKTYNAFSLRLGDGTQNLAAEGSTHPMKLALFLAAGSANTLTNALYGDLTSEHANANGYTTGGVALTGVTWTVSGNVATLTATNLAPAWTASGGSITARYGVIYIDATVNSVVKPLVAVSLLDTTPADVTALAGNPFNFTFNASGIITVTGANVD
jgi:hypothetical protein